MRRAIDNRPFILYDLSTFPDEPGSMSCLSYLYSTIQSIVDEMFIAQEEFVRISSLISTSPTHLKPSERRLSVTLLQ